MDKVELYVKQRRLLEANIRGEDKDSILRKSIDVALAMGMKHISLAGKHLRTVDEIMTAMRVDGKINVDNATAPPEIREQLKALEAGKRG